MSFGTNNTTKAAENNLGGLSNLMMNVRAPYFDTTGSGELGAGQANVNSGTNFFNTLLSGNTANTMAMLQPSINNIRGSNANLLSTLSSLTPRGGGRSGSLFATSLAPATEINNLFGTGRTTAAATLPGIGLQQEGIGTNLFGLGNQALSTASGANTSLGQMGLEQQRINQQALQGLGGLLASLGMPFMNKLANLINPNKNPVATTPANAGTPGATGVPGSPNYAGGASYTSPSGGYTPMLNYTPLPTGYPPNDPNVTVPNMYFGIAH
jgi:hypothetical protein